MEFVKVMQAKKKMCEYYDDSCIDCPLDDAAPAEGCDTYIEEYPEAAERIITEWTEKHKPITNAQKFEKIFGCILAESYEHPGYFYILDRDIESESDAEKWLNSKYEEVIKI